MSGTAGPLATSRPTSPRDRRPARGWRRTARDVWLRRATCARPHGPAPGRTRSRLAAAPPPWTGSDRAARRLPGRAGPAPRRVRRHCVSPPRRPVPAGPAGRGRSSRPPTARGTPRRRRSHHGIELSRRTARAPRPRPRRVTASLAIGARPGDPGRGLRRSPRTTLGAQLAAAGAMTAGRPPSEPADAGTKWSSRR